MEIGSKYRQLVITEYPRWWLVLHEKQHPYIGRCYAWWKDTYSGEGEGMSLDHLAPRDLVEVFHRIHRDVLIGCKALGHCTNALGTDFLLNVDYLANMEEHNHHMHIHFVPRFKGPVEVDALLGRRFEDLMWGKNWARVRDFVLPPAELLVIRDTMAAAIEGRP